MRTIRVFAPAKINLTLHVTGQREDGYHLLDSLVTFAPVGDELLMSPSGVSSLTVEGPEARGVPADLDNLALRAAMIVLREGAAALTLDKRLPAASGIGGGSADAAAAVRGALMLLDQDTQDLLAYGDLSHLEIFRPIVELGADVPMCLWPRPLRARGIGEMVRFAQVPPVAAVLVNPRVSVSTPQVFKGLTRRDNPPMPDALPDFADAASLIAWLAEQRNDMQDSACAIAPAITDVLDALAASPGCALARMSGSGATCFGLFASQDDAMSAAAALGEAHPAWWVAGGSLGDQTARALPRRV